MAGRSMTAPTLLGADLIRTVVDAARHSPRNLQQAIGPSEVGHPCSRRIAYKVAGAPRTWTDADPWASIIGTAVHAWLAAAFAAENLVLDEPRWLVEQRVHPSSGLSGSCDLYDTHTDTVIDHKVVGSTTLADAKAHGPTPQYRIQVHTYGLGWERLGKQPREVAIAYWPRSGYLSGLYVWREPYDRSIADAALDRLSNISAAALSLDIVEHPERTALIPAAPSDSCSHCAYKSSAARDGGCPDTPRRQAPTSIPGVT